MAKPTPIKQQQKEQTRARLVHAALRVFSLQGYDHATVEEISLAAGHSKGAYYFHFDSKEGIFLELLERWADEQGHRLRAPESGVELSAAAFLNTLEGFLRYDDREPEWALLLPEFWAQAHRNERVQETLRKGYARWLKLLTALFERGAAERWFKPAVQPETAAGLVLALHDGLIVQSRLRPGQGATGLSRTLGALISLLTTAPEASPQPTVPPASRRTVKRSH